MSNINDQNFNELSKEFPNLDVGSFDLGWIRARNHILKILETNEIGYHELTSGGQIDEIENL